MDVETKVARQLKSFDWRARRARLAGNVPPEILALAADIVRDIVEGI